MLRFDGPRPADKADATAIAREWMGRPPEDQVQRMGFILMGWRDEPKSLIERSQSVELPNLEAAKTHKRLKELAARPSLALRALHKRLGLPDPAKENHPVAAGRR